MAGTEKTPRGPEESAAAGSTAEDDRGYEVPDKVWLVHGSIIVAFALFISMVMLLFVRWNSSKEPNSTLVFRGREGLAGVEVHIDGPKLDESMTQRITKAGGYEVRFVVPGGNYLVRVLRDGVPLAKDSSVTVHEGEGQTYELSRSLEAATRPATQPL